MNDTAVVAEHIKEVQGGRRQVRREMEAEGGRLHIHPPSPITTQAEGPAAGNG